MIVQDRISSDESIEDFYDDFNSEEIQEGEWMIEEISTSEAELLENEFLDNELY